MVHTLSGSKAFTSPLQASTVDFRLEYVTSIIFCFIVTVGGDFKVIVGPQGEILVVNEDESFVELKGIRLHPLRLPNAGEFLHVRYDLRDEVMLFGVENEHGVKLTEPVPLALLSPTDEIVFQTHSGDGGGTLRLH